MDNGGNDCRITRRVVLASSALALGAAAAAMAVPQAAAQLKIGQADAKYQGTPKGDQRCSDCFNYRPANACKCVEGDISAGGWCERFASKT